MLQSSGFLTEFFSGNLCRCAESYNARDILGRGAQAALLAAAKHDRRKPSFLPHVQGANTFGTMQLVCREREQINLQASDVERDFASGLHCVGVEQDSMQLGQVGEFLDRLDRAHDVVCRHDRDQSDVRLRRAKQAVGTNQAIGINREERDLCSAAGEKLAGFENRSVLDCTGDDVAGIAADSIGADEGEIVGFGAAGPVPAAPI